MLLSAPKSHFTILKYFFFAAPMKTAFEYNHSVGWFRLNIFGFVSILSLKTIWNHISQLQSWFFSASKWLDQSHHCCFLWQITIPFIILLLANVSVVVTMAHDVRKDKFSLADRHTSYSTKSAAAKSLRRWRQLLSPKRSPHSFFPQDTCCVVPFDAAVLDLWTPIARAVVQGLFS